MPAVHPPPTVAVLGTGKMGTALARRLAASGLTVVVWNRTRARAEALGVGRVAPTPADAAAAADVVVSSLTGPDAVRAAYLGPAGALETRGPELIVEMSTAGPAIIDELGPRVRAAGARLVDAPILGMPPTIERGEAILLAGGDPADVARAAAVLGPVGTVRHVGPLGHGARLKLVSNAMLADALTAAAELQAAGEAVGLAPEEVFWVLARQAPLLEPRRPTYVASGDQAVLFALRDLRKDLDLALDMFHDDGAPAPLTAATREVTGEVARERAAEDVAALIHRYRPRPAAGV